MYKVELTRRAQRALDKLPKDDVIAILTSANDLSNIPRPRGTEKIKTTGLWRIRQGDYRIVYIDDSQKLVIILCIGHRQEIYRSL